MTEKVNLIYPAQCECGHIYLEKYQFNEPTELGIAGFCWCGFCRKRLNVFVDNSFSYNAHALQAREEGEK